MMSRLSTVAPDLMNRLAAQESEVLSNLARAAAVWVVDSVGLRDSGVTEVMEQLGNSERPSADCVNSLRVIVQKLDEAAWELQDKLDAGESIGSDYELTFGRARAASAVLFAASADPLSAASEAIYEAHAAIGTWEELNRLIDAELL
jgi:hypothetical protein